MNKRLDRWTLLPAALIAVSLLIAVCDGYDGHPVSAPAVPADSAPVFPTHDEPLATDWGNDYFMGELVVREGCLRVVGDEDINGPRPAPSFLLVWPEGFTLVEVEDGSTIVEDTTGAIVARVGNDVRFSGWCARSESDFGEGLAGSLPDECVGPYFVVGDDVTVVGPDEPETVSIPGFHAVLSSEEDHEVRMGTRNPGRRLLRTNGTVRRKRLPATRGQRR